MFEEDMVWVPPGPFVAGEGAAQHVETLDHGFWIDRFPVTNAQYRAFLLQAVRGTEKWFELENRLENPACADHPATGITWRGAAAFAEWRGARLPKQIEWEKAARGIDGRVYPWGNEFDAGRCNTDSEGTTAVHRYGAAGASPFGCFDMAGNVWEWTASDSGTGEVFTWRTGKREVILPLKWLCGGCWAMPAHHARCAARTADFTPIRGSSVVGFRCVRDATPQGSASLELILN
jgi:formylglycine-generating enzyme required for sulfatase activity